MIMMFRGKDKSFWRRRGIASWEGRFRGQDMMDRRQAPSQPPQDADKPVIVRDVND